MERFKLGGVLGWKACGAGLHRPTQDSGVSMEAQCLMTLAFFLLWACNHSKDGPSQLFARLGFYFLYIFLGFPFAFHSLFASEN